MGVKGEGLGWGIRMESNDEYQGQQLADRTLAMLRSAPLLTKYSITNVCVFSAAK